MKAPIRIKTMSALAMLMAIGLLIRFFAMANLVFMFVSVPRTKNKLAKSMSIMANANQYSLNIEYENTWWPKPFMSEYGILKFAPKMNKLCSNSPGAIIKLNRKKMTTTA